MKKEAVVEVQIYRYLPLHVYISQRNVSFPTPWPYFSASGICIITLTTGFLLLPELAKFSCCATVKTLSHDASTEYNLTDIQLCSDISIADIIELSAV